LAEFIKFFDKFMRTLTELKCFKWKAGFEASGRYLTYEFIKKQLDDDDKKVSVDLENFDPSTVYFVTDVREYGNYTVSGFKLKATNQWHLFTRWARRDVLWEVMYNEGHEKGFGRCFWENGEVGTGFRQNGWPKGYMYYKVDGSIEKV